MSKLFQVYWNQNQTQLNVIIQDRSEPISLTYDKYCEICDNHKFIKMPPISLEYQLYCIHNEWCQPSYIQEFSTGKVYPISLVRLEIAGAIQAINKSDIFERESNLLQDPEFYPFPAPPGVGAANDTNLLCLPKCTIL